MPISGKINLTGKVALVTGANGSIGYASAKALLREGAKVIVTDYASTSELDIATDENVLAIDADITNEEAILDLVDKAREKFGSIDILVHCAGIYEVTPFEELPLEKWRRLIDINLTGTFIITKSVYKVMKEQNYGKIVCLSSNAGQTGGEAAGVHYSASKGGVISFVKRLSKSGAPHNIYVNAIAPSPVNSKMIDGVEFKEGDFPLGRLGEPEDIAESVIFLSSQASNYITGQVLGVNGGLVV